MTLEEFLKKLEVALEDKDTAEGLKSFGIEPEQIEGFKDLTIPTTLDEALKIKGVQSDYDKRLGKAAQTREEKLRSKFKFVEKDGEEEEEEEEEMNTDNPVIKSLMETVKELKKDLDQQKQEKQKETLAEKRTRAMEYLKSKGILPVYVHELDLEKDIEEQFDAVKKKFEEDGGLIKPQTKPGAGRLPNPRNPGANNEPSKEEVEAFKKVF